MQIGFGQISPSASSTRDLGTRLSLRFTREKCKNVHVPSFLSATLLRSPLYCADVYLSLWPVAFAVVTTSLRHYCTWIFQTHKGKSVKYKCKQKRYSIQLLVVASLGSRRQCQKKDTKLALEMETRILQMQNTFSSWQTRSENIMD